MRVIAIESMEPTIIYVFLETLTVSSTLETLSIIKDLNHVLITDILSRVVQ